MQELLEKFAKKIATLQNYTVKTADRTRIAKHYLETADERCATVLLMALRALYGIEILYWEPETLWLTLEKDGLDLSEESRNKVQAAITLIHNPTFFWDNIAFQRITQALNDEFFDPEALQECHPAHMAWSVYESTVIRGLDPEEQSIPELDEDVQQYAAVCLKRAGYVYPPDQLKPVADNLAKMLPVEQATFIDTVKKTWEHLDKKTLLDRKFQEDPLDVQLAQLAACYDYVRTRANKLAEDVLSLERINVI